LALALATTSALLGGGELGLGVGWEGRAKEGEDIRVDVPKIFTSNDGVTSVGLEDSGF